MSTINNLFQIIGENPALNINVKIEAISFENDEIEAVAFEYNAWKYTPDEYQILLDYLQ